MLSYLLKILEVRRETDDVVTIVLKQPGLKKVKYLPGQYLTLVVTINNRKYKRPYSFSSSPGIDDNIEVTIKRVIGGLVSNHLCDTTKVGDLQEVMEPLGDFVYNEIIHNDKIIYLWGAGSGITPLISILKYSLRVNSKKVILNYSNRTKSEVIFLEQLLMIKQQYPDTFKLNFFYTKEKYSDSCYGRINEIHIEEILKESSIEGIEQAHFICGPVGLKERVKKALIHLKNNEVHSEDFDRIIEETQLVDVQTQFVNISKQGKVEKIEVVRGRSILEAALDFGIDLSYSCQTGNCGLCKAKIKSGQVKVITTEHSIAELQADEYLICCSYPIDNQVFVEVD